MTLTRRLTRAGALRAVAFVVARPGLDFFLRRLVYRFPNLAGRVRAAVARSRRAEQNLSSTIIDETDLTDSALQVLHDLQRAVAQNGRN